MVDQPIPFLQSFGWALPSVMLADIWQVLGFHMIVLVTGLQSIPPHLYEAARVDGAPALGRFLHITLPMLRPSPARAPGRMAPQRLVLLHQPTPDTVPDVVVEAGK